MMWPNGLSFLSRFEGGRSRESLSRDKKLNPLAAFLGSGGPEGHISTFDI
jgi:hypothetical protein